MDVLGVVENMSSFKCPNCGERIELFGEGGGKKMAEEIGVPFLGSVPFNPEIVKSGEEGDPSSYLSSESSGSFDKIVTKLKKKVGD